MANATWPTGLPQYVNASDYKETHIDNVIRSQMQVGSKTRLRDTKEVRQFEVSVSLKGNAQKQLLRTFYRDTLRFGSLPFDWIEFSDHTSIVAYSMLGPPQFRSRGGGDNYIASIKLVTF